MKTLHESINNVLPPKLFLLFFSNPDYFNQIFPGIILPPLFLSQKNVSQACVMLSLSNSFPGVIAYKRNLLVSQIILKRYFRFSFISIGVPVTIPNITNKITNKYEAAVKYALYTLGLHTMAHVHQDGGVYRTLMTDPGRRPLTDTIDFNTNLNGVLCNPSSLPLTIVV